MSNLNEASAQWSSRPADERFWSLQDLETSLKSERVNSREKLTDLKTCKVEAQNGQIAVVGPSGNSYNFNHWSFGQFSGLCHAPSGYLQSLPAQLACENLRHGIATIDKSQGKFLLNVETKTVRAVTGEGYGRLWNQDVVHCLRPALDLGWMTPPARPAVNDPRARKATAADIVPNQENFSLAIKEGDTIAPAGVYCGDRDMFVFLVNPNRIIDDGCKGMMRGVFVTNTEVGGAAAKVKMFYLENVCGNHICWNVSGFKELKFVHRTKSILRFDQASIAQLRAYADANVLQEQGMILAARQKEIGKNKDEVVAAIYGNKAYGLGKGDASAAFDMAVKWEHTALSAPTTVWGMVHGLTRYSQQTSWADQRQAIDAVAGKLLKSVTNTNKESAA